MTAGKVDIGAFRTHPENYTPENVASFEYQSIPFTQDRRFWCTRKSTLSTGSRNLQIKS
ncbi:hypothetical protein F5051DRAFT_151723 [Lentinula edodes]|nr:hypothetical protein F5051DRAFT_151723 [Lentinula edodes]